MASTFITRAKSFVGLIYRRVSRAAVLLVITSTSEEVPSLFQTIPVKLQSSIKSQIPFPLVGDNAAQLSLLGMT